MADYFKDLKFEYQVAIDKHVELLALDGDRVVSGCPNPRKYTVVPADQTDDPGFLEWVQATCAPPFESQEAQSNMADMIEGIAAITGQEELVCGLVEGLRAGTTRITSVSCTTEPVDG